MKHIQARISLLQQRFLLRIAAHTVPGCLHVPAAWAVAIAE
jgi:hypothetical protein